jgi:hypothetical protein
MHELKLIFVKLLVLFNLDNGDVKREKKYNRAIGNLPVLMKNDSNRMIIDGELEPPFPNLEKSNETLEGIDLNQNGIRDDVEIWINHNFKTYNYRTIMKLVAKSLQANVVMGEKINKSIKSVSYEQYREQFISFYGLFFCLNNIKLLESKDIKVHHNDFDYLFDIITNNNQRSTASDTFDNGLNPNEKYKHENLLSLVQKSPEDWILKCQFNLQNVDEIKIKLDLILHKNVRQRIKK